MILRAMISSDTSAVQGLQPTRAHFGLARIQTLHFALAAVLRKRLPSPPYNPGVRELVKGKRAASRPLPQNAVDCGFLGWHESGYLPHRDEPGLIQFVTFRLVDAFPTQLRSECPSRAQQAQKANASDF